MVVALCLRGATTWDVNFLLDEKIIAFVGYGIVGRSYGFGSEVLYP